MRISFSRKFVFVHKYKCAGTSIAAAMDPYSEIRSWYLSPYYHHESLASIEEHFEAMGWGIDEFTVFTTVRNPITMLGSLYHWGHPDQDGQYWWERRWSDLVAGRGIDREGRIAANPIDFRDWVMTSDFTEFALDRFINGQNGRRRAEVVLKFETIEADFAALCERLQLPATPLPHLKKNSNPTPSFDAEMLRKVRADFATDIEVGGYSLN